MSSTVVSAKPLRAKRSSEARKMRSRSSALRRSRRLERATVEEVVATIIDLYSYMTIGHFTPGIHRNSESLSQSFEAGMDFIRMGEDRNFGGSQPSPGQALPTDGGNPSISRPDDR